MPPLKLTKLPNRKPVRVTIKVAPELKRALDSYAAAYNSVYGENEPISVLIPHILESFLASDRVFAKSMKAKDGEMRPPRNEARSRRRSDASPTHSSSVEGAR